MNWLPVLVIPSCLSTFPDWSRRGTSPIYEQARSFVPIRSGFPTINAKANEITGPTPGTVCNRSVTSYFLQSFAIFLSYNLICWLNSRIEISKPSKIFISSGDNCFADSAEKFSTLKSSISIPRLLKRLLAVQISDERLWTNLSLIFSTAKSRICSIEACLIGANNFISALASLASISASSRSHLWTLHQTAANLRALPT